MLKKVLAFVLFFNISTALACSCPIPDKTRTMAEADILFVGTALEIVKSDDNLEQFTTFKIVEVVKGEISDEVVVKTNISGKACGWTFVIDETVMVAAYNREKYYETSSCDMYAFQ